MSRKLTVAAAQLGPVRRAEPRRSVVARMIALLKEAAGVGCAFVTFPEMALTTFFPRWHIEDAEEVAGFFEDSMPGPETNPLFDAARTLGIGFYLGYCERMPGREGADHLGYNTSILVDRMARASLSASTARCTCPATRSLRREPQAAASGALVLPRARRSRFSGVRHFMGGRFGHAAVQRPALARGLAHARPTRAQKWCALGYNSPAQLPDNPAQNALRKTAPPPAHAGRRLSERPVDHREPPRRAPRKAVDMMGHSCIIAPSGEVVALSSSVGDELLTLPDRPRRDCLSTSGSSISEPIGGRRPMAC